MIHSSLEMSACQGLLPEEIREQYRTKERTMQEPLLQFFTYAHLPDNLKAVSAPFCDLATTIYSMLGLANELSATVQNCALTVLTIEESISGPEKCEADQPEQPDNSLRAVLHRALRKSRSLLDRLQGLADEIDGNSERATIKFPGRAG